MLQEGLAPGLNDRVGTPNCYGSLAANSGWLLSPLTYTCDWSDRMQVTSAVECKRVGVVTWVQLRIHEAIGGLSGDMPGLSGPTA